ncbi:hypothetical protein D5085_03855 [Ectothiorhodospiraceae bacterium BW-2]|nr:hypothetical protein D5085_03855 [Ectothiorhodospiraceae bacterium BW-2]
MRLTAEQQYQIRHCFEQVFEHGSIYLFGSRVDDQQRGGDIDLFLELEEHERLFEKKIKFLAKLKRQIGDQKIDVVFNLDPSWPIEQEARKWGIAL